MPTEDLTDFDLAEMDPYAITPHERAIIDAQIASGSSSSDEDLRDYVADVIERRPDEIVSMARIGHNRLLAKRLIALIVEGQMGVDRDLIVELRAIVTDPAST